MRRFHCSTATWHVFARGTRRLELFRTNEDCQVFIQCLVFALRASGCLLWGYALMSNHYHLVLRGDSDQLTRCMYLLNRIYALYHNKTHHLGGHVFDGPYKAYRIRTPRLALWTLAYVFLNPVKAGLCAGPEDYPWSGYRSFVGLPGSPLAVDPSPLMTSVDLPLNRAWERFHDAVRIQLQRKTTPLPDRPTMAEVHQSQFEGLLEHVRSSVMDLKDEDRDLVAACLGRDCGIAVRVISAVLDRPNRAEFSRELYRFRQRAAQDARLAGLLQLP